MKPSLFTLLFLLAFIIIASSAKAQFVVDVNGDIVNNGGKYYILPHIWAFDGGLELAKTGNETCPLSVVQSPSEVDNGLPWKIFNKYKVRFLPTNADVDFFSVEGKVPSCVPLLSNWNIVEGDDRIKSVKISEVGFENTFKGSFQIQEVTSRAYKIVFCPINCESCADLGISRDDHGNRRLVITDDQPLVVVFVKAKLSQVSQL